MKNILAISTLGIAVAAVSVSALAIDRGDTIDQQSATTSAEQTWPVKQIKTAFQNDPDLKERDIHIEVRGETARLQGSVQSREEKEHAEEIAQAVNGIKYVRNQLIINDSISKGSADEGTMDKLSKLASDSAITARIKLALLGTNIDAVKVNVDTVDSVVTLKGTVESEDQKELTQEIAMNTDGVKKVKNELKVVQKPS